MSEASRIQEKISEALEAKGALSQPIPVVKRTPGDFKSDLEAASKMIGICIHVLPVLPTSKLEGTEGIIFFDGAEVIVRIYEIIEMNRSGVTGYELIEEVANALHWTNPGGLLSYPLEVAKRPVKQADIPAYEINGKQYPQSRIFDVMFNATYQIKGPETMTGPEGYEP